jgi:hypothetical protein
MTKQGAIAFVLAALAVCGTARAVDLENNDHQNYVVKIHDGASTSTGTIYSISVQKQVCSKCEIEVVGVGSIKVSGSVTVTIKNGALSTH